MTFTPGQTGHTAEHNSIRADLDTRLSDVALHEEFVSVDGDGNLVIGSTIIPIDASVDPATLAAAIQTELTTNTDVVNGAALGAAAKAQSDTGLTRSVALTKNRLEIWDKDPGTHTDAVQLFVGEQLAASSPWLWYLGSERVDGSWRILEGQLKSGHRYPWALNNRPAQIDVMDYIPSGTPLPNDITNILLAARAAAVSLATFTSLPVQILLPEGDFTISADIPVATRVGYKGRGMSRTRLRMTNLARFQYGNLVGDTDNADGNTWMEDNVYEDFWVDGYPPAGTSYNSQWKNFFVQNMRRPVFRRVRSSGSIATNIGIDFIVQGLIEWCYVDNSGIGQAASQTSGTGAAIGIGVGRTTDESLIIRDCILTGSTSNTLFFEQLVGRGATLQSPGTATIERVTMSGAPIGISDCGAGGLIIRDCDISFTNLGLAVRSGGQSPVAGKDGLVQRTTFRRTGSPISATYAGTAVLFSGTGGGYRISDPRFENITVEAIRVASDADLSVGGLVVDQIDQVQDVGSALVRVDRTTKALQKLWVSGRRVTGFGKALGTGSAGSRAAVWLYADVIDARLLCDSEVIGHGASGAEQIGVRVESAVVFGTPPRTERMVTIDVPTPTGYTNSPTTTYIRDNATYTTP